VYRGRLILYGCGDFINDYEGIQGYEQYRDDLALMYFAALSRATGSFTALSVTPMQIRNVKLHRATPADSQWCRETLERVSAPYGTHVDPISNGTLTLRWE
jgi:poly-gamma-glutamate synthesis protein (capsule biosynthesis protein)